ncbi:hypothetical protein [Pseudomonas psychrophila]|uniref:hypothetical protein n=1 Tax=Pseudomonas psychrophila TaxID=122355 RepID=UPI0002F5BCCC|nr:hypothetical protein [Pseudomonas psychrophila]
MSDQSAEDIESKLTELENKLPTLDLVNNLLWRTTPQCQVLLNESLATAKPVKITRAAKRFTPEEPFYLDSINFYGENSKIPTNLAVIIKPLGKPSYNLNLITLDSNIKFVFGYARSFCEWFEIYSSSTLNNPKLTKIRIYGTGIKEISEHSEDIVAIINLKRDLEKFKETLRNDCTELHESISSLTEDKTLLESSLAKVSNAHALKMSELRLITANLQTESEKFENAQDSLVRSESLLTQTKNNIEQLNETVLSHNKDISKLKAELTKLTSDKNLISDEYGPYVKEGRSQAAIYVFLITLPLLAIIFSIYELYSGASKLLLADYKNTAEIIGSFILRIPFAAVFGIAIYYSWRLTSTIIQKIFTIHSDRLTLAKLLVLARESVHSAAKNLDISNEILFQEQVHLKVEVLKSHLSKDLGNSFEYPTAMPKSKQPKRNEAVNDNEIESTEEAAK